MIDIYLLQVYSDPPWGPQHVSDGPPSGTKARQISGRRSN